MSDRAITAPNMAMRRRLESLIRRQRRTSIRQRWHGAVHADIAASQSVTPTANFMVSSPPDFADPAFTICASVTLDPGRWFFNAGCSVSADAPGFFFRYLAVAQVRASTSSDPTRLTAVESGGDGGFDEGFVDPLLVGGVLLLDVEDTIVFEVGYSHEKTDNTGVSVTAEDAFLIVGPL